MPEPQPGADRPADGSTPVTDRERDPAVTDEPTRSPVPPTAEPAGDPDDPSAPHDRLQLPAPTRRVEVPGTSDDLVESRPQSSPTDDDQVEAATLADGDDPDGDDPAPPAAPAAAGAGSAPEPPPAKPTRPDPAAPRPDPAAPQPDPAPPEPDPAAPQLEPAEPEPAAPTGEPVTDTDATPAVPARGSATVTPARGSAAVPAPARPTGSAQVPGRPDPTRVTADTTPVPGQPEPTRTENRPDPTRVESPAPRWSGSAPVPPPPPRKRGWGESAEPTPLPPAPVESPEHQVPVDPWAGADTGGWELHSAAFPALPPTLPYPSAPHTLPYPAQTAPPPQQPPVVRPPTAARPVSPPPAPGSPPRPAPPAPVRPPKQRRREAPPPVTPPPGWQAPRGYVPVPVRRRRRWPWVLLLTVACCCGVPLWWAQPFSTQYPASAALPDEVTGLQLRDDARSQATVRQLEAEVRQSNLLAEDTFAGVYGTSDGKRVTVFGSTGVRFSPESDAKAELTRLQERYQLDPAVPVETGVRGRYERCAVGRVDGDAVVVCTSVDHGSLATGVFTRLSLDDSGRLLDELRQQIITPDQS